MSSQRQHKTEAPAADPPYEPDEAELDALGQRLSRLDWPEPDADMRERCLKEFQERLLEREKQSED